VSLLGQTRLSVDGQSAREQSHAGSSHRPFHIVLLLGMALVSVAYESALLVDRKSEASSQTEQGPGPIPPDGPLSRPKSLQQIGVPVEATRAAAPDDNPQTPEKIALGEKLFFDGRLSVDGTVACSTCHDPARAFTDGRPVSMGVNGRVGQRNAPTILNALYNAAQFWDGRAKTLEEQAALPIINPSKMGQPSLDAAVARIAAVPEYEQAFRHVFGRAPNGTDLVRAIASYERTQFSFDSPFDRFIEGEQMPCLDGTKARSGLLYG
jgi:cytochrome c peroxidase